MRIHIRSLILCSSLMNFLYFHISVDYIITYSVSPTSTHLSVLSLRDSRWTLPYGLSCWLPIIKNLGFNHIPSNQFFLLSPHSHLYPVRILCCSLISFRGFQQFKGFWIARLKFSYHSMLFTNMGGCQQFSKLKVIKFILSL